MTSKVYPKKALSVDIERNFFRHQGLIMKPVEDFEIFNGFSCCSPDDNDVDIDEFIRHDARRHFKDKVAVTYGLFLDEPDKDHYPLGFATLQNDAIRMEGTKYPYTNMPAVKIGRFGIRCEIQGMGFGANFLAMIRMFMSQADNRTGCCYLTLNTYPIPKLLKFYDDNNFLVLDGLPKNPKPTKQLIMYLDLVKSSAYRPPRQLKKPQIHIPKPHKQKKSRTNPR